MVQRPRVQQRQQNRGSAVVKQRPPSLQKTETPAQTQYRNAEQQAESRQKGTPGNAGRNEPRSR
jgi:hypothetical protein